jgi:type IV pilus biogenesis protein CpaD/CtpE
MKNKTRISVVLAAAATAACSQIPEQAYFNRGAAESLLEVSSEVVNISLADEAGTDELVSWVNQEQPSRAELFCNDTDPACSNAKSVLEQFNVGYQQTQDAKNTVALYYERVMARDCENRYIDNSVNPYNLHHPTFGCSVAANSVQMVSDKRQFVNPGLLDYTDGNKAVQAHKAYQKPPKEASDAGKSALGGASAVSR